MGIEQPVQVMNITADADGKLYLNGTEVTFTTTSTNTAEFGGATVVPTVNVPLLDVVEQVLTTLRKIEYHLSIASDTQLNDEDV